MLLAYRLVDASTPEARDSLWAWHQPWIDHCAPTGQTATRPCRICEERVRRRIRRVPDGVCCAATRGRHRERSPGAPAR